MKREKCQPEKTGLFLMAISLRKLSQSSHVRPHFVIFPRSSGHSLKLFARKKTKTKNPQINIQRNCMKRISAVKEHINYLKKQRYRNKGQHFLLNLSSGHSLYDIPKFSAFYSTFCIQSKCQQIRLTVFKTEKFSQVGY